MTSLSLLETSWISICTYVIEVHAPHSSGEPMAYSQVIVSGIISGVLSSAIVWLFYRFWSDTLLPWYQIRVYRGVSVQDLWIGTRVDGNNTFAFSLKIKQRGHNLAGTFTAKDKLATGEETENIFDLHGVITNSYVLLTYTPASAHRYGSGAFLFHIFNAGEQLRGGMLYLQTRTGLIGAVTDITLDRR